MATYNVSIAEACNATDGDFATALYETCSAADACDAPATFPAYPQAEATILVPRAAVRNRYATNLKVYPTQFASAAFNDPTVAWVGLSASNYSAFLTFYGANCARPFIYVHQPSTVTMMCVFDDAKPFEYKNYNALGGQLLYDVTVYLRQAS
jgi:hypothetical protein